MIVLRLSWLLSKAKWVEIVWKVKLVPRGSHSSISAEQPSRITQNVCK